MATLFLWPISTEPISNQCLQHTGAHIRGCGGWTTPPQNFTISYKKSVRKNLWKVKSQSQHRSGLNMQITQSCFAINCVYICISEFGKSVPQSSSPSPPKFYEDWCPCQHIGCTIVVPNKVRFFKEWSNWWILCIIKNVGRHLKIVAVICVWHNP